MNITSLDRVIKKGIPKKATFYSNCEGYEEANPMGIRYKTTTNIY